MCGLLALMNYFEIDTYTYIQLVCTVREMLSAQLTVRHSYLISHTILLLGQLQYWDHCLPYPYKYLHIRRLKYMQHIVVMVDFGPRKPFRSNLGVFQKITL